MKICSYGDGSTSFPAGGNTQRTYIVDPDSGKGLCPGCGETLIMTRQDKRWLIPIHRQQQHVDAELERIAMERLRERRTRKKALKKLSGAERAALRKYFIEQYNSGEDCD